MGDCPPLYSNSASDFCRSYYYWAKSYSTQDGSKTVSNLCCFDGHTRLNVLEISLGLTRIYIRSTLPKVTHKVFLEVEIDDINVGKIVLGLFGTVAPKTVENFRALCACDADDKKLCYKGSTFHRVMPNFMIQGGDVVHGDGTGGSSIYNNGGTFEDEGFKVTFNRKFLVAMANNGPDTNASQFFITTVKTQWLTGKNVVFGKVVDGSETIVKAIEEQGTNGGAPRAKIVIVDSGVMEVTESYDDDKDPHHLKDLPSYHYPEDGHVDHEKKSEEE